MVTSWVLATPGTEQPDQVLRVLQVGARLRERWEVRVVAVRR